MTYLERAKRFAQECHAGQVDKAGYDYIDHDRVADAVKDDVDAEIVAWLHDVLEDGAEEFAAQVFGFNKLIWKIPFFFFHSCRYFVLRERR